MDLFLKDTLIVLVIILGKRVIKSLEQQMNYLDEYLKNYYQYQQNFFILLIQEILAKYFKVY
ncbi:unnamed protein product [Paramecium pentaurelia]|uniref:Uncharacterized protein n=1 Tax=Paramecium pentaurelia TaxID=43138 RepID=A0A8S1WHP2_9CILI|nr:unnamed protein product [Paramecium pentaurelia]